MYTFLLPLRRAGLTSPAVWDKSTGHVTRQKSLACPVCGPHPRIEDRGSSSAGSWRAVLLSQNTGTLLGSWERACWDTQEARPVSLSMMTPGSGLESFIAFNQSCLAWQGKEGRGSLEGPVKLPIKMISFSSHSPQLCHSSCSRAPQIFPAPASQGEAST